MREMNIPAKIAEKKRGFSSSSCLKLVASKERIHMRGLNKKQPEVTRFPPWTQKAEFLGRSLFIPSPTLVEGLDVYTSRPAMNSERQRTDEFLDQLPSQ